MKGLKDFAKFNLITVFGFTVVANVAVAAFLGWLIDKWTFNNKVIFVIFLFLGVISGVYNGIRDLLKEAERYERLDREDEKNGGSSGDR